MESTLISWCDDTHNYWMGCTPVSPGCDNCYARALMQDRYGKVEFGEGKPRVRKANFSADIERWREKPWVCTNCESRLVAPLSPTTTPMCPRCGGTVRRRRVFSLSLGDFFDREVNLAWIYEALLVVMNSPELDHLILTKRPWAIRTRLNACEMLARGAITTDGVQPNAALAAWLHDWLAGKAPHNVWIGITGEDRKWLRERWDTVTAIGGVAARQYFLSLEPLLEDVSNILKGILTEASLRKLPVWTLIGGESGPGARACWEWWIRQTVEVCQEFAFPVFVKQVGRRCLTSTALIETEWPAGTRITEDPLARELAGARVRVGHPKGGDPREWPKKLRVRQQPCMEEESNIVC